MSKKSIYSCDICGKECRPVIGKGCDYGHLSGIHSWEVLRGAGIIVGARVFLPREESDKLVGNDTTHACTSCVIRSLESAIQELKEEVAQ